MRTTALTWFALLLSSACVTISGCGQGQDRDNNHPQPTTKSIQITGNQPAGRQGISTEWKKTEFEGFNLSQAEIFVDGNGQKFKIDLSQLKSPYQIKGDKKFHKFTGALEFEDIFYSYALHPLPGKPTVDIWAPFIFEESIPPWATSKTPIYAHLNGKDIQIGHYMETEKGHPMASVRYHNPVFCEEEYSDVCQLTLRTYSSASLKDFQIWGFDGYFDHFLIEAELTVKDEGKSFSFSYRSAAK